MAFTINTVKAILSYHHYQPKHSFSRIENEKIRTLFRVRIYPMWLAKSYSNKRLPDYREAVLHNSLDCFERRFAFVLFTPLRSAFVWGFRATAKNNANVVCAARGSASGLRQPRWTGCYELLILLPEVLLKSCY